jgi:GAF domain-containing protein
MGVWRVDRIGGVPATADVFARLAVELYDTPGLDETIEAVVEFALQAVCCTHAGIALHQRGAVRIAAVTDPVIEAMYQLQLDAGDGPLISALTDQAMVRVRDAAEETRWPEWSATMTGLGLRSVLHLPLRVGAQAVGVLSLYHTEPHAFSADDEAVAHILARHASVAVASAWQEATLAEAVDARKLIGQAMGILMERHGVDDDRAFAILRRYSQDHNIKLRDVAQQLIDTRKLPTRRETYKA